jgi:hypothetical protein
MGLRLVGHHPIRSRGGYSNRRGLNATFTFEGPRSPRLAPWLSYVYKPMNPYYFHPTETILRLRNAIWVASGKFFGHMS